MLIYKNRLYTQLTFFSHSVCCLGERTICIVVFVHTFSIYIFILYYDNQQTSFMFCLLFKCVARDFFPLIIKIFFSTLVKNKLYSHIYNIFMGKKNALFSLLCCVVSPFFQHVALHLFKFQLIMAR
jgi:hypothetical protein